MRRWALLLLALVPAACGGSSPAKTQGQSTLASTATSASTPGTTSPTSTTPTTVASTPSTLTTPTTTGARTSPLPIGPPRCTAARLRLSSLGQQGATGHGVLGFALRNTSARACQTFGYPGVLFLDSTARALPTQPARVTSDLLGSAPVRLLVLNPGQIASFRLGVTHGSGSSAGCATADVVQVIPPDDTQTLRVGIPGGAYECTTVTVTPLQPGLSAYPNQ